MSRTCYCDAGDPAGHVHLLSGPPHEPGCLGNHLGDCAVSGLFDAEVAGPSIFDEVRTLRARLAAVEAELSEEVELRNAQFQRAEAAEAKLAAVEALHFQYRGPSDPDSCAHCNQISGGLEIRYPCPTIAAARGEATE